jgi:hypothetical protein
MIVRALITVSVAGALAGCAGDNTTTAAAPPPAPQAAPPAAAPATPATTGAPVNGVYRGASMMTKNGGGRCAQAGARTFAIRSRTLSVHWNPTTTLEAKIQPDGTFSTQSGVTTMSGKAEGGQLEVDIQNEYCGYHYSLKHV